MLVKFKLADLQGKSSLVGINPKQVVAVQGAYDGCMIFTTRATFHVTANLDSVIQALTAGENND